MMLIVSCIIMRLITLFVGWDQDYDIGDPSFQIGMKIFTRPSIYPRPDRIIDT